MYCPKCGHTMGAGDKFCPICGTVYQQMNIEFYNGVPREMVLDCVGDNRFYYQNEFDEIARNSNKYISWNWAACFLQGFWLLQKRAYAAFIITLIISGIVVQIQAIGWILPFIAFGLFGNRIYYESLNVKIKNKHCKGLSDNSILNSCSPSYAPVFIYLGALVLLIALFVILAIMGVAIGGMFLDELPFYFHSGGKFYY